MEQVRERGHAEFYGRNELVDLGRIELPSQQPASTRGARRREAGANAVSRLPCLCLVEIPGIEPGSQQCECRVLPLYDIPGRHRRAGLPLYDRLMDTIELLNVPRLAYLIWIFLQLFHVEHLQKSTDSKLRGQASGTFYSHRGPHERGAHNLGSQEIWRGPNVVKEHEFLG